MDINNFEVIQTTGATGDPWTAGGHPRMPDLTKSSAALPLEPPPP